MRQAPRQFLVFALACLLAACGREQTEAITDLAPVDLVLLGGEIATVDAVIGNVQALAVDGYTIAAVGTDEEISAYIGPETEVIALDGRFVIPGFIEGHGHFLSLGESLRILDLNEVRDWDEIVRMVAVAADKARPG